jgi:ABC-type cobalamin/Fe3+-siderophores transport system ATPase subunit
MNFETGDGIEHLNRIREARRVTRSQYVANKIGIVKNTYSNGETGFMRFIDSIIPDRLYILDEPENSLSCELQIELAKYIELSARYYGCQFIIATHSPFLMAISGAKLYNLDGKPATISKFWELPNMQLYYNLFKKYDREFDAQRQSVNEEQGDSDDWEEVTGNPIPMDENSKSIDDYLKEGYMTLEEMTQAIEQKFAKRQKDEVMNKIRHNSSFDYE